ncbi:S1 family peptidase, partial [Streptosporangium sp. G11]
MSRRYAATAGCVLAVTALTLAAVPAGADRGQSVPAQATAPIAAKRPAIDPPPGMLEALQRDLEL